MANLNKVFLAGNLTREPEMRYTPGGAAICGLGLAVNRRFTTRDGQQQEETCFVDVEAWGKQAEICQQYLRKGSPVLIEGRLRYDAWDDRESGKKRSRLTVTAEYVQFLGRGESGDGGGRSGGSEADGPADRRHSRPGEGYMGKPARRDDGGNDAPPEDDAADDIPF